MRRGAICVLLLTLFLATACGSTVTARRLTWGPTHPSGGTMPLLAGTPAVVNGCNPTADGATPAPPFGFCLSTPPHFRCCSAAAMPLSGIVAGETRRIAGAIPIDPATGKPQSSAVEIRDPDGRTVLLKPGASGAFSATVAFPTGGAYVIGAVYHGHLADATVFAVPWRYAIVKGMLVTTLFPASVVKWPTGDTVLAVAAGKPQTVTVRLEYANGKPAANAPAGPSGPRADARGLVTFSVDAHTFEAPPAELAPGLFYQTYETLTMTPQGVRGALPNPKGYRPFSATVPVVRSGGQTLYDAFDFLTVADPTSFISPGQGTIRLDPTTQTMTVVDPNGGRSFRVNAAADLLQEGTWEGAGSQWVYRGDLGRVYPVFANGRLYLSAADLSSMLNAYGWARLLGSNRILFSSSFLP